MITLTEAKRRYLLYRRSATLIFMGVIPLVLLSFVKAIYAFTEGYATWMTPSLIRAGAAVHAGIVWLYQLPMMPALWDWMPAWNPPLCLLEWPMVVCMIAFYIGGLLKRASLILGFELNTAHAQAQQALWQLEMLGMRSALPPSDQGHSRTHPKSQQVDEGPWSARPAGIVILSVIGGLIAGVGTQWLNLKLGLTK
jgi:hypothetical protein